MDPAPVTTRARWPAHRRLVTDLGLGACALGAALGYAVFGRPGIIGAAIGGGLGVLVGLYVGPRRLHLTLDAHGVAIGRLTGTVRIPWSELAAFGIEDGWQGRRGLTTALAVGRRGDEWPVAVPALAYHAWGFRIGGPSPRDQLAPHRARLLTPVRAWAEARSIPVVESDLDDWWDRNRDALRR